MRIRAGTRLLAVVGDPVAHSLSPRMHNAALAALGVDAVYLALRVGPDGFEALSRGLLAAGAGLNVTVPHKRLAAALADEPSDLVRRTGACNVLRATLRGIEADNTDAEAIAAAARGLARGLPVRRALLVGTGGSARSAAVGLSQSWPEVVVDVRSRDAGRLREFLQWAEGAGVTAEPGRETGVDLVVNATPLGLLPSDPLPLEESDLRSRAPAAVLDLTYARGRTRLVRAARRLGLEAEDGRTVLVEQGAASFALFVGAPAPVEVMRAAVQESLGD